MAEKRVSVAMNIDTAEEMPTYSRNFTKFMRDVKKEIGEDVDLNVEVSVNPMTDLNAILGQVAEQPQGDEKFMGFTAPTDYEIEYEEEEAD